jgi:hypothetical protein
VTRVVTIAVAVGGLVLSSAAGGTPASAGNDDGSPPTTSTTPQPLAEPFPHPQKILFVGDSIADSLDEPLAAVAAANGVPFSATVVAGCGNTGGVPADPAGVPYPHAIVCQQGIPETHTRVVAQQQPDLVVWLSYWEISNRVVNGQVEQIGTIGANELLLADIDQAVARLTAGGARLIFVAPALPAAESGEPYDPEEAADLQRLGVLLRAYARAHADRVTVVELSEIVCPTGPPCPADIGGFRPRATDGQHFEGPGAVWVAEQLFPKLLGAPAMTSTPPASVNAGLAPVG